MAGSYRDLLTRPGVLPFTTAGFIGRVPKPMLTLGIVLYVTDLTGSYALAGAMSATLVLAAAFIGPFGARLMDRFGQDRVVWALASCQAAALLSFVFAAQANIPIPVQFLLLVIAGGVDPSFGSAVRARWAHLFRGDPKLGSAFAWESVVDEIAFIVGPLLATILALGIAPWAPIVASAGLIMIAAIWLSLQSATQPLRQPKIEAVNRQRILGPVMLVAVAVMVLMGGAFGSFEVSTVAFAQELDQPGAMGPVLSLFAAGSLLSGLTFGAVRPTAPLGRQLQFAATFVAIVVVPLPFISTIPVLAVAAFIAGLSVAPVLILTITIVERVVHASRLTEAFTITISGLAVGLAFGSTLSGALVDAHTPSAGYAVMTVSGIGALAVVLVSARTLKSVRPKPPQV